MWMHTCTGCVVSGDCEKQAAIRAQTKGLGISSVKHACRQRRPIYQPGDAVIFETVGYEDREEWSEAYKLAFPGHVVRQVRGKVIGFISAGAVDLERDWPWEPRGNGYVKMPLSRVRPDPTRPPAKADKCDWCGNHPGLGARCENSFSGHPPKCLAKASEKEAA